MHQRNRLIYAILASQLGMFGVHNFYLGYRGRGIAQCVLTLSCIGLPFSLVWSMVELFQTSHDSQGVPMFDPAPRTRKTLSFLAAACLAVLAGFLLFLMILFPRMMENVATIACMSHEFQIRQTALGNIQNGEFHADPSLLDGEKALHCPFQRKGKCYYAVQGVGPGMSSNMPLIVERPGNHFDRGVCIAFLNGVRKVSVDGTRFLDLLPKLDGISEDERELLRRQFEVWDASSR